MAIVRGAIVLGGNFLGGIVWWANVQGGTVLFSIPLRSFLLLWPKPYFQIEHQALSSPSFEIFLIFISFLKPHVLSRLVTREAATYIHGLFYQAQSIVRGYFLFTNFQMACYSNSLFKICLLLTCFFKYHQIVHKQLFHPLYLNIFFSFF